MKIEQIELREIRMPLKSPFETSFGLTSIRRMILLKVFSEGMYGIGEVACGEEPGYNHEATDMAWIALTDFLLPHLIGKNLEDAFGFESTAKKIRGNHFAKGAISMALHDVFAKAANLPLWKFLGGTKTMLPIGLSIGIKQSPEALAEFLSQQKTSGFKRFKLKIGPGRDLAFVDAARNAIGPDTALTVDANSAYSLADTALLKKLDDYNLQYIEQPLGYDDIVDHATLSKELLTPICLDEPIHSSDDVRKAHLLGSGKVINLKLGRVDGYAESIKIAKFCAANNLGLWCGGMLESGVGRAHNLALQTLPGFTLASDTAPSNRYWETDIIEPEISMIDGMASPLPGVGLGVNLRDDLIHNLTARVLNIA